MNFGEALERVKSGKKIQREGWNGKNQFVELGSHVSYVRPNGEVVNANHEAMGNQVLVFHGTSGVQVGWLASQADMLAEDWRVANDTMDEMKLLPCPFCGSKAEYRETSGPIPYSGKWRGSAVLGVAFEADVRTV